MGISQATFYIWKKKYGELGASEVRSFRQLEDENARLKRLVADLTLDKNILLEVIKKDLKPVRRRELAVWIRQTYVLALDKACELAKLFRSSWYKPRKNYQQEGLRIRIRGIANERLRFCYERIHVMLRREGWQINLKRVHRLYCLESLQVRMRRRRKKRMSLLRAMPLPASGPNERWRMDFVHDRLNNGLAVRVLTVVDNWNRESVLSETGFRLISREVILALDRAAQCRNLPASITVDHGTEFTSLVMDDWAHANHASLAFTRPRKPTDNRLCELFNGRLKDECLNVHEFKSIEEARYIIKTWRYDYNENRALNSLGNLTPK